MKRFFEKELSSLRGRLSEIGRKSVEQVRLAVRALMESDGELAAWVRTQDDDVDRLEMEIDAEAIRYVSLRAPIATELRLVLTAMNAAHEVERVGDEACNIAKRVQKLSPRSVDVGMLGDLEAMARMVAEMLEAALDAFFEGDADKALAVCRRDADVDKIHKRFAREMTRRTVSNAETAPMIIELLFIGRSLERIGDHATNIAEEVLYVHRGLDIRHTPLAKGRVAEADTGEPADEGEGRTIPKRYPHGIEP